MYFVKGHSIFRNLLVATNVESLELMQRLEPNEALVRDPRAN